MVAPTRVASDYASSGVAVTSQAITIPSTGIDPGDTLLLFAAQGYIGGTLSAPSGWTQVVQGGGTNQPKLAVWKRTAQSGDAGTSVTVSSSSNAVLSVYVLAYRSAGVIAASTVTAAFGTGATLTPPTVAQDAALLFWAAHRNAGVDIVWGAGATEWRDDQNGSALRSSIADRSVSAGTPATQSFSTASSQQYAALSVAVEAAAATPPTALALSFAASSSLAVALPGPSATALALAFSATSTLTVTPVGVPTVRLAMFGGTASILQTALGVGYTVVQGPTGAAGDTSAELDTWWGANGLFDAIILDLATNGDLWSWVKAKWEAGLPLLVGGANAPVIEYGLATGKTYVAGQNVDIWSTHQIVAGYSGSVQVTSAAGIYHATGWVGDVHAVISSNSTRAAVGTVERGLTLLAGTMAPATAPARVATIGWISYNQTADGATMIRRAIDWVVTDPQTVLSGLAFAGSSALSVTLPSPIALTFAGDSGLAIALPGATPLSLEFDATSYFATEPRVLALSFDAVGALYVNPVVSTPTPLQLAFAGTSDLDVVLPDPLPVLPLEFTTDSSMTVLFENTLTLAMRGTASLGITWTYEAPWVWNPGVIVTRWTLFEPDTGESWTMPINPDQMTTPHTGKNLTFAKGTRKQLDRVRTFMTAPTAPTWEWSGVIRTKEHYDAYVKWAEKPGRIHVHDHLGRTWVVYLQSFEPEDRRPMANVPWRLRYTVKALMIREIS